MRTILIWTLAGLLVTGTCWGQESPPDETETADEAESLPPEAFAEPKTPSIPMLAVSEARNLSGTNRVRYLLRQLDLNYQQRELARGLIASILDQGENQPFTVPQVMALMAEIQEAEAAGDEERKKQLEQQLRDLAKGFDQSDEFFMNMEPELTAEQKAKLKAARERLERNPSGALRPIDVFRLLDNLKTTPEQREEITKVQKQFRASLRKVEQLNDQKRFQIMNGLLERIHATLTPEQRSEFDTGVNRLRPDRVGLGLRARASSSNQPTEDTPDDETGEN